MKTTLIIIDQNGEARAVNGVMEDLLNRICKSRRASQDASLLFRDGSTAKLKGKRRAAMLKDILLSDAYEFLLQTFDVSICHCCATITLEKLAWTYSGGYCKACRAEFDSDPGAGPTCCNCNTEQSTRWLDLPAGEFTCEACKIKKASLQMRRPQPNKED